MENRIFIFGHYGEKNTGDDAMIFVLLQELHKIYPKSNFSVISSRKFFFPPGIEDKIRLIKPVQINVFKEIMNSSIFIMGGGTQIYDYGRRLERFKTLSQMLIIIYWAKLFCENIYFLNIGVEPFKTTIRKFLSKRICKLADFISIRDKYSYLILEDMGIKKTLQSFDLSVLLSPFDSINKFRSNKIEIVGMSILPFYEIYHNKKYLDYLIVDEIAISVNEWLKSNSKNKLHLFVFKGKSRSDDFNITNILKEKIENEEQVKIVPYENNPLKTLSQINNCDIFVGMRYHSCLFAYMTKTPLLVISYFQKCRALAEEIKLPNRAIIPINDILNGNFNKYFLDILENEESFIGSLPLSKAKKKAKIGLIIKKE